MTHLCNKTGQWLIVLAPLSQQTTENETEYESEKKSSQTKEVHLVTPRLLMK